MNIYLIIILSVLIFDYILQNIIEGLNIKNLSYDIPKEFKDFYDKDKYKKSQEYLKATTKFHNRKDTFHIFIMIPFILLGGFGYVDTFARGFGFGETLTGLVFFGSLILLENIFSLPFSYYNIFVLEEKFGFNKTTVSTFILDFFKGLILMALLGSIVLAGVILFFQKLGSSAWIYAWLAVTIFEFFIVFIAPAVIMPLFNKFEPLEDGELKTAISNYAKQQKFHLDGIFVMDGSRRSTKSNAFFVGFGKYRRVVLYDTLIKNHTVDELVGVLAHEIGHYKKRHMFKLIAYSVLTSGLMFFLLSLFIKNPLLFDAFKIDNLSIYASLCLFGFLYSPINTILSIFSKHFSRKYEYEADRFAVETCNYKEDLILALKKLVVHNLSNLTPHPLKVFLEYTHPPVLERINFMRGIIKEGGN